MVLKSTNKSKQTTKKVTQVGWSKLVLWRALTASHLCLPKPQIFEKVQEAEEHH